MDGGVIRYKALNGERLQGTLDAAQFEYRMKCAYDPYHAALDLNSRLGVVEFGRFIHLNLHSFPTIDWHCHLPSMPFEIEVGDLGGESSPRNVGKLIVRSLINEGFSVGYNETFHGAEIVRRVTKICGENADVIQIEVRRDLYLKDDVELDIGRMQKNGGSIVRGLMRALVMIDGRLL
jgi:N-formylglutamate amidohydrolase